MKIKRIPLQYPETPEGRDRDKFRAKVREAHQGYLGAIMTLEQTTAEMQQHAEKQYNDYIDKLIKGSVIERVQEFIR